MLKNKKYISVLVLLILLVVLLYPLVSGWEVIVQYPWVFSFNNSIFLLIALVLVFPINIFCWHIVLRQLTPDLTIWENAEIWMTSNLARLLPGGIWQYPGRVILTSKKGVSRQISTTAVLLETLFNLLVGALVVLITLPSWNIPEKFKPSFIIIFLTVTFLIAFIVLLDRRLFFHLLRIIGKLTNKGQNLIASFTLSPKYIFLIILAFLLKFIITGSVFFFLLRLTTSISMNDFTDFIGIYAFSWLAGYIVFLAPGGIGVIETALATLTSFYIPLPIAVMVALAYRILISLAEVVTLLPLLAVVKKIKQH